MNAPLSPLIAFQAGHREIEERLLAHQEALVTLDLYGAARELASYRAELEVHMAVEEDVVIPAFEALGVDIRGGGAHFYRLEHEKLGELLAWVERGLDEVRSRGASRARDVLPLLKRGLKLEHLMEHHETRENDLLYPTLEDRLHPAERDALAERMRRREIRARAAADAAVR